MSSCDLPSAPETRRVCLFIPDSVSVPFLFCRPVSPGFPISHAMRTRAQVGTEGRELGDRDRGPQAGACHASCARSHLEGIRLQDRGPGPLGCGALSLQSLEGACPCLARLGPGQPQCDGQTLGTTAQRSSGRSSKPAVPRRTCQRSALLAGGQASVKWAQAGEPSSLTCFQRIHIHFS